MMRFKFDANQQYQIDAIEAVVDLFTGQTPISAGFGLQAGQSAMLAAGPNRLDLDEQTLLSNLCQVQERHGIQTDEELKVIEEGGERPDGPASVAFPDFSLEMETGTTKTS